MDEVLGFAALVIAMFLVMAAAVEAVLEMLRGLLERLGFGWTRSGVSLDDALAAAVEAVDEAERRIALRRMKAALDESILRIGRGAGELAKIRQSLGNLSGGISELAQDQLVETATKAKAWLDERETSRVLLLRGLAIVIGVALALATDVNVATMIHSDPALAAMFGFEVVDGRVVGELGPVAAGLGAAVTGVAASGGSAYWHDKIDKVRNLKQLSGSVKALRLQTA